MARTECRDVGESHARNRESKREVQGTLGRRDRECVVPSKGGKRRAVPRLVWFAGIVALSCSARLPAFDGPKIRSGRVRAIFVSKAVADGEGRSER